MVTCLEQGDLLSAKSKLKTNWGSNGGREHNKTLTETTNLSDICQFELYNLIPEYAVSNLLGHMQMNCIFFS